MPINVGTKRGIRTLWNPSMLGGNLSLWLDATDLNTIILNGSNVSSWLDKSLYRNTVSQGTSSKQPSYSSGSTPHVAFSTTNAQQLLTPGNAALPLGTTDRIVYAVWSTSSIVGSGATSNGLFTYGDRVAANTGTSVGVIFSQNRDIWMTINNVDAYETVNTNTGQIYIETFILSAQNVFIRKYGSPVGNGAFAYTTNAGYLSVGNCNWTSGGIIASNASIYELIITNSAQFPYQIVEGYLSWKWGKQAQLPGGHPFQLFPPMVLA
jgi:hypothetical protein